MNKAYAKVDISKEFSCEKSDLCALQKGFWYWRSKIPLREGVLPVLFHGAQTVTQQELWEGRVDR